jgi:transcriptional regulator
VYVPRPFHEDDPRFIRQVMGSHPFAALVSSVNDVPTATHLLLRARDAPGGLELCGHMARQNPQWKGFGPGREVLAIFQGPHAYVSAAWYSVPSAPTWNYVTVHAWGVPSLVEDRAELHALLKDLVDWQEEHSPPERRYTLEGLPAAVRDPMMDAIVGFRIRVTRIEAASKLSQNRSGDDHETIARMLEERGDASSAAVAREMRRRSAGGHGGR